QFSRARKRVDQRDHGLHGARSGSISVLKNTDTLVVLVPSAQGRSHDLIGQAAIVADAANSVGNLLRADPVLTCQSDLRQRRQYRDVVWPAARQFDQNVLSTPDLSPALEERSIVEANRRVEVGRFGRVSILLLG